MRLTFSMLMVSVLVVGGWWYWYEHPTQPLSYLNRTSDVIVQKIVNGSVVSTVLISPNKDPDGWTKIEKCFDRPFSRLGLWPAGSIKYILQQQSVDGRSTTKFSVIPLGLVEVELPGGRKEFVRSDLHAFAGLDELPFQ